MADEQPDQPSTSASAGHKRTRVLLSCGPCRVSKLKCDRASPCSTCLKRGRPEACVYAPKPNKVKPPPRSMAARLRRLEGMVRGMLEEDDESDGDGAGNRSGLAARLRPGAADDAEGDAAAAREKGARGGRVVKGERATTYVGATHFMAMLDDIEDLKSYFEDDPEETDAGSPEAFIDVDSPERILLSKSLPRTKADLLQLVPERHVVDRLIMRYFTSNSPSQHSVHRPTFVRQYNEFWQDPPKVDVQWLALLFMVMALGIYFSTWSSPHELELDGATPPMERFKQFRSAAGWALVSGKFGSPVLLTIQPFLLYVEAEFLISRTSQTSCWLLSAVCIRIMLKMGLHRDPSQLPNISPFDGEMRKRMWNLAIQLDLILSFHLGLPSMIHGIESDTGLPRNLIDEDFDENAAEIPPGRPLTEYTHMSYPVFKGVVCRVFGQVSRLSNSLTVAPYSETMRLDGLLEEKWAQIPTFMKVRPLEECLTDSPMQVLQRFGLASLYQKSRCVLHRRYLVETVPKKEHDYSRRVCLQAALDLMGYQHTIFQATQPGGVLSQNGWFLTSLAMNDFLLASMIVYLVVQSNSYPEAGESPSPAWMAQDGSPLPDKQYLIDLLQKSHRIWISLSWDIPEVKKASDLLGVMLDKIKAREQRRGKEVQRGQSSLSTEVPLSNLCLDAYPRLSSLPHDRRLGGEPQSTLTRQDLVPNAMTGFDSWVPMTTTSLDWNSLDSGLRATTSNPGASEWLEPTALDGNLNFMADGGWSDPSTSHGQ